MARNRKSPNTNTTQGEGTTMSLFSAVSEEREQALASRTRNRGVGAEVIRAFLSQDEDSPTYNFAEISLTEGPFAGRKPKGVKTTLDNARKKAENADLTNAVQIIADDEGVAIRRLS